MAELEEIAFHAHHEFFSLDAGALIIPNNDGDLPLRAIIVHQPAKAED